MEIGISNFRVVHASGGDWRDLTEACINQLGDTQSGENIGFVYVTDALDKNVRAIVDRLRGQTGISQWVGTVGFGICVSGIELFDTPSIAIMLGCLPPDSFRVLPSIDSFSPALSVFLDVAVHIDRYPDSERRVSRLRL